MTSLKKKVGEYILEEQIGIGAFGEVHRATKEGSSEIFAIKMLKKKTMPPKVLSYLEREAEILQMVDHENIVKLKDIKVSQNNYYLIFEFCNGGDLAVYRKKKGGKLSEGIARDFTKQIVHALDALYQKNGIHRDIKLSNILLHYPTPDSKAKDIPITKLGDFGFARIIGNGEEGIGSDVPVEMSIVGTPLNMAPELFMRKPYTLKADIWSLGTIVYEMLCGGPAFMGVNREDLIKNVEQGGFKIYKHCNLSVEALDFICSCCQFNPTNRLSWAQVLVHPFISGSKSTPFTMKQILKIKGGTGKIVEEKDYYIFNSQMQVTFNSLVEEEKAPIIAPPPKKAEEEIKVVNILYAI